MKNPIIQGIEIAIAGHKAELKKYEAMLALYNSGPNAENYNPKRDGQLNRLVKEKLQEGKRGSKPGVKRGSYKKRKNASKKFKQNLKSPDWRKEVPKALQGMNPLTAREITEKIAPGVHKKTRRVLAARCSAMLVWLKKEGLVKEVRSDDGHHVTYTV